MTSENIALLSIFSVGWIATLIGAPTFLASYVFVAICAVYAIYRLPLSISKDTLSNFFFYERKMPSKHFVGTLVATNVGFASSIVFSASLIYFFGIGVALLSVIAWFFGLIFFSAHLHKMIPFFRTGTTLHQFIAESFGTTPRERAALGALSSVITFLLYFGSLGIEVKITSDVFAPITGLSQYNLAIFLGICGILYTAINGFRGVASVANLQMGSMIIGVIAIFISVFTLKADHPIELPIDFFNLRNITVGPDVSVSLSILVLLILYQFCVMDMWQRCISVINSTDLLSGNAPTDADISSALRRLLVRDSLIPFCIVFAGWYTIGIFALGHGINATNGQDILAWYLQELSASSQTSVWSAILLTLIMSAFLAAALSTFDAFAISAAQTIIFDWRPVLFPNAKPIAQIENTEEARILLISRVVITAICVLSILVAFWKFDFLSFWVGMYSLMIPFFPAVYIALVNDANRHLYTARLIGLSIFLGSTSALVTALYGTFYNKDDTIAALAVVVGLGISGSVILVAGRIGRERNH